MKRISGDWQAIVLKRKFSTLLDKECVDLSHLKGFVRRSLPSTTNYNFADEGSSGGPALANSAIIEKYKTFKIFKLKKMSRVSVYPEM